MLSGRVIEGVPHILGRYLLLNQKLGSGNYATVVEAVHLDLEVHVAIKIIDTSKVRDRYVLRHLAREAALLRRLAHPNIIAVFESMRAGPLYCLVTELAAGGELSAYVSRQPDGHLSETESVRFASQLFSALAHMHDRGVVHRDLKMRNILLNRTHDVVKIVDFGLSNVWSEENPLRTHCGSPGYAAPEIYILGRTYGPEVDMWSLGVVLFGMAAGRLPFPTCKDKTISQHERRKRMIAQISRGARESHIRAIGHFSPLFSDLVSRLLTAAPAQRLTIKEAILHPWLTSRPSSGRLYRLTARESGFIYSQLSILLNMSVKALEEQCRLNRLGEVGAAYNILAHQQLSTYHVALGGRAPVRSSTLETSDKAASEFDLALAGKNDASRDRISLHSSIDDVLQSGVDSCQYTERVSTSEDSLKGSFKNRISMLTVESKSTTEVAPLWPTNSPGKLPDESSKPSNLRRPPSIRSQSSCFPKSVGFDDNAAKSQASRTLLKPPKSVSFSTLSVRESRHAKENCSKIDKRRPVTSIATNTTETVHRSMQTGLDHKDVSQQTSNTSCSLENVQWIVGSVDTLVKTSKSIPSVDHLKDVTSRGEQHKEKKDIETNRSSTPIFMQAINKKAQSLLSTKSNGTLLPNTRTNSKPSTAGNKHTLKQSTLNERNCLSSKAQKRADLPQTTKLITGTSQSKTLLKSTCSSQHNACSTEITENSEHRQTYKNNLKKWRRKPTCTKYPGTRFMMDVALQKTLERTNNIPPIPQSVWAYNKKANTLTTRSKTKPPQQKISTPELQRRKDKKEEAFNPRISSAQTRTVPLK